MDKAYLYDSTQTLIQNIVIQNVTENRPFKNAIHMLPASDMNMVQHLGRKSPTYVIKGFYRFINTVGQSWGYDEYYDEYYERGTILNPNDVLRSLYGTNGFFEFHTAYLDIPITPVYFKNVNFADRGKRPLEREFAIEAVER